MEILQSVVWKQGTDNTEDTPLIWHKHMHRLYTY